MPRVYGEIGEDRGSGLNVLVACEESQAVCKAFRARGHRAFSCDIQDCSGGHPEWHIKGDVLPLLNGGSFKTIGGGGYMVDRWDLIIAHPPCTYLSNAGACRLYHDGKLDLERFYKGMVGKALFMAIWNADCDRIAIENPMPSNIFDLPKPTQIIQPYEFGDPWTKKTYLWLKGLPPLQPTNTCQEAKPFIGSGTGRKLRGDTYGAHIAHDGYARSKTFEGIAIAMSQQWTAQDVSKCEIEQQVLGGFYT